MICLLKHSPHKLITMTPVFMKTNIIDYSFLLSVVPFEMISRLSSSVKGRSNSERMIGLLIHSPHKLISMAPVFMKTDTRLLLFAASSALRNDLLAFQYV